MKRTTSVSLSLVAFGIALAGCSSGEDGPPPFETGQTSLVDRLALATGARWASDPHPVSGKPSLFLSLDEGRPVLSSAHDTKEPLAFLEPYRDGLGIHEPLSNEFDGGTAVTSAGPAYLGLTRYRQRVPGTDVHVFDGDILVGVAEGGSLGYIESWAASGLENFDATPRISVQRATELALALVPDGVIATSDAATLGVRATDPDHPVLVFRIRLQDTAASRRIDIDGKTGAVVANELESSTGVESVFSAQSMFAGGDRRVATAKSLPIEVTNGFIGGKIDSGNLVVRTSVSETPSDCAKKTPRRASEHAIPVVTLPVPEGVPAVPGTADVRISDACDAHYKISRTPGIAVDAAHHVQTIANYFAGQLQMPVWADMSNDVTLVVHDDAWVGNAVFAPATKTIRIGDGELLPNSLVYKTYSPATSLEFMAHEYSHGVIYAVTSGRLSNPRNPIGTPLGVSGEAGALNEGIADVFAAGIEALVTNSGVGLWEFAPELRSDRNGFRNYRNPSKGADKGALHMKVVRPFSGNQDQGEIHYNSLLVTQAWALMIHGGYNQYSKIGVTAEIDLPLSIRLFWDTLKSTSGSQATMARFAEKMLQHQRDGIPALNPSQTNLGKKWVRYSLVCAWTAVGVLTPEIALSRYGVTCPSDGSEIEAPNCKGRADGVYCDSRPQYDYDAFECRNGSIRGGAQCGSAKYCYRTKGTFKSFAQTGPDGRALCFDEPQSE